MSTDNVTPTPCELSDVTGMTREETELIQRFRKMSEREKAAFESFVFALSGNPVMRERVAEACVRCGLSRLEATLAVFYELTPRAH